jgi:hypothetical protein
MSANYMLIGSMDLCGATTTFPYYLIAEIVNSERCGRVSNAVPTIFKLERLERNLLNKLPSLY